MIPCYGYLRVSGLTQASEDRGGLERQETAIRAFASAKGYELTRIFTDAGVSGKTDLENRPALMELLSELGQVRTVLIEKLDRLARDLLVQETILTDFQKRGITVISTCEPDMGGNDPSRKLVRQIFGAIAEFDRAMIVLRLKAGADRARSQGKRWGGQPAYGAHKKYPSETEVVQKIREFNVKGLTLTAIAQQLNETGLKPRTGQKFYPMQIARILNQEKPQ